MSHISSKLFDRPGYVSAKEYVNDINHIKVNGPWKLPFGVMDRAHFFLLTVIIKFSWFTDVLYIVNSSSIGPGYKIIFSFLKKTLSIDSMSVRSLSLRGYYSFYLEKRIVQSNNTWTMSGQGVAEDKATAFSKALGEMMERAISGMFDMNKDISFASPKEFIKKYPVMYPPIHHRFLDIQKNKFKELLHDEGKPIAWMKGKNLITKERTYIPKQITSWFSENMKARGIFINATTNGIAGYFTKDGAVLRGLLEVVQRDAFLVHWLTMTPPEVILEETLPEKIREKIKEFELFGISVYLLNVTSISIPTIFIAAINRQAKLPQVVLSGASAVSFEEAILSALTEMVMVSEMFHYRNPVVESKYKNIKLEPFISSVGKIGRQLYWRGDERVAEFEYFLSGERVSYGEVCKKNLVCKEDDSAQLEACLGVLKNFGSDYYPVVYFPENKLQKKLGFYIAQVYIPKAFPLYLFEAYGTFDSDRLTDFAKSKNKLDWKLNPHPHMFS